MTLQEKATEKATELTRRIYTWGIRKEGQSLSMKESRELASIIVDEIKKANPIIPLTSMLESEALDEAYTYWQEVDKELLNLRYETKREDTLETPTTHG